MTVIVVKPPVLSVGGTVARLSADLLGPEKTEPLWFECDAVHAGKLATETCDGLFIAALLLAMRRGLDLVVDGPLSSRLYYHVKTYYVELVRSLIPGMHKVSLVADHLTRAEYPGTGVLTAFSGGIDSLCTVIEHQTGSVPAEYEVTHLLLNNVGSHGQLENDLRVFRERCARLAVHARSLNLPLIAVNSNLDGILGMAFQLTHTIRNAAVALLFQRACAKYLYSSTVHYRDSRVEETYDMGYADAIAVPLLSTESMECVSSGSQHTRFQKTEIVAGFRASYRMLDVCVAPARAREKGCVNCSLCWKCLRTQLSFEVLGVLQNYRAVFDLPAYRRLRWLYLCGVLGSPSALEREIREEMAKRGFSVPWSARAVAAVAPRRLLDLVTRLVGLDRAGAKRLWRRLLDRVVARLR